VEGCPGRFRYVDGFLDLVVGGRFEDEEDEARTAHEEEANVYTAAHYWIPLFQRLTRSVEGRPRVLAVGCGTGVEVDMLSEAGFECVGIDCGQRTRSWPRRRSRDALLSANGMSLPFPDSTYDVAFCGCVFPHVGVAGDSFVVTERRHADRLAMAREMTRVVKAGGHIVVTGPNRRFPFDLFHGRDSGTYRVRPYWPGDPFLLSVTDYGRLFREAGARGIEALPVRGYWGFLRSRQTWKGWLLGLPVRFLFWLVDRLPFLRPSPLAPWIAVLVRR
jgi:SAM-dependent methyltransferase